MKDPKKYFEVIDLALDTLADSCNVGNVLVQYKDVLYAVDRLKKAMAMERFTKGKENHV